MQIASRFSSKVAVVFLCKFTDRTLGRIIVHQLLEHLLPAGEFYIYKSVCVVQIAAVHTEKVFDALVELRLVVVQEE